MNVQQHPSVSALGSHLDELFEKTGPTGNRSDRNDQTMAKVARAVTELRKHMTPPSAADTETEDAMHLGR